MLTLSRRKCQFSRYYKTFTNKICDVHLDFIIFCYTKNIRRGLNPEQRWPNEHQGRLFRRAPVSLLSPVQQEKAPWIFFFAAAATPLSPHEQKYDRA